MKKTNILKSLVVALSVASQAISAEISLPFYEYTQAQDDNISILLEEGSSLPSRERYPGIIAVNESGKVCSGKLQKYRKEVENDNCGKPSKQLVVGDYEFEESCLSGPKPLIILPGRIANLAKLPSFGRTPDSVVNRLLTEKLITPTVDEAQASEYTRGFKWIMNSSGKKTLQSQVGSGSFEELKITSDSCEYLLSGDYEFLYCKPLEEFRGSMDPNWVFFYSKGELVFAVTDATGSGLDGYDPFFYSRQDPVVMYKANGNAVVAFRPGFAIVNSDGRWQKLSRQPLRFYGEPGPCDE